MQAPQVMLGTATVAALALGVVSNAPWPKRQDNCESQRNTDLLRTVYQGPKAL